MKKKNKFLAIATLFVASSLAQPPSTSYDANSIPVSGVGCVGIGSNVLTGIAQDYATAVGFESLSQGFTGGYNSAIGYQSGYLLESWYSSAVGAFALYGATYGLGTNNTAIGAYSSFHGPGTSNTSVGYMSLYNGDYLSDYNTAVGNMALYTNTASYLTAVGNRALYSNSTGEANTAVGNSALENNSTGRSNTAVGNLSLLNNTTGMFNNAFGDSTLMSNTTGTSNVAIGSAALSSNTDGKGNIGVGVNTLKFNTTGRFNSAIGHLAMEYNQTGNSNTAIGGGALMANLTGESNTALGETALFDNVSGNYNVAVGELSQGNATNSSYNTSVGNLSLRYPDGNFNSAFGVWAAGLSGGNYNTILGARSFYGLYGNGDNNSSLGYGTNRSVITDSNMTVIGSNAIVSTSDKVRLGDVNVTVVEGQVAYTNPSDGRFKFNVNEEDVKGLEFIKKLRPVVYNFDTKKFQNFLSKNMPDSIKKRYMQRNFEASSAIRQSGFIAQEVELAAKESGYEFNGVHKPNAEGDNYGLAYGLFVVPLVKAVQEQQKIIEQQNEELKSMKSDILALKNAKETTKPKDFNNSNNFTSSLSDIGSLGQNEPNPFTHETLIKYNISKTVSMAVMGIYDLTGKEIKKIPLSHQTDSSIVINSENLEPGIYIYTIVADGVLLDSKRMIVASK